MRRMHATIAMLTWVIGIGAVHPVGVFAQQQTARAAAPAEQPAPVEATAALTKVPFADDEKLFVGDDLITKVDAPLIGDDDKVLLTLSKGLPLVARDTYEHWVLVDVNYQGQPVTGWVHRKHLTLISPESPGVVHEEIRDIPKRLAELHASSEQHLSRADFLQSLETCSAVLKIDPTSALAFYRRGHCQQMLGEDDKAIADFDRAIELEPRYEGAFLARGDARYARGEFDLAIADYESALEADPKSAGALYMRGRCRYALGDYDQAIADYDAALQIDANYAWAIAHRGDARFARNDFDGAIADLDKATQIDRTFDWAVARRADVWFFGKKDIDRAIADYTFAYTLNPRNSWAIHQRGHCMEKKRDFAQAVGDYASAVELDPEYWDFRTNLAWVLATCPEENVRDGAKAVELAYDACELTEWKDSFALGALAAAYAEIGQFDKAVEFARKAVEQKTPQYDLQTAESIVQIYRSNKPYHEK